MPGGGLDRANSLQHAREQSTNSQKTLRPFDSSATLDVLAVSVEIKVDTPMSYPLYIDSTPAQLGFDVSHVEQQALEALEDDLEDDLEGLESQVAKGDQTVESKLESLHDYLQIHLLKAEAESKKFSISHPLADDALTKALQGRFWEKSVLQMDGSERIFAIPENCFNPLLDKAYMEHGDQFLRSTLTGQIAKLEKLPRYFEILGLETDKNALSAINAHRELCRDDVLATADHVVLNQKRKKIENAIAQVAICINSKSEICNIEKALAARLPKDGGLRLKFTKDQDVAKLKTRLAKAAKQYAESRASFTDIFPDNHGLRDIEYLTNCHELLKIGQHRAISLENELQQTDAVRHDKIQKVNDILQRLIKEAFRNQSLIYHPDKCKHHRPKGVPKFSAEELNIAYSTLIDPRIRFVYVDMNDHVKWLRSPHKRAFELHVTNSVFSWRKGRAKNDLQDHSRQLLIEGGKPHRVTKPQVTLATQTQKAARLYITWKFGSIEEYAITAFILEAARVDVAKDLLITNSTEKTSSEIINMPTTNAFRCIYKGLDTLFTTDYFPIGEYLFRVMAQNAMGASPYSLTESFVVEEKNSGSEVKGKRLQKRVTARNALQSILINLEDVEGKVNMRSPIAQKLLVLTEAINKAKEHKVEQLDPYLVRFGEQALNDLRNKDAARVNLGPWKVLTKLLIKDTTGSLTEEDLNSMREALEQTSLASMVYISTREELHDRGCRLPHFSKFIVHVPLLPPDVKNMLAQSIHKAFEMTLSDSCSIASFVESLMKLNSDWRDENIVMQITSPITRCRHIHETVKEHKVSDLLGKWSQKLKVSWERLENQMTIDILKYRNRKEAAKREPGKVASVATPIRIAAPKKKEKATQGKNVSSLLKTKAENTTPTPSATRPGIEKIDPNSAFATGKSMWKAHVEIGVVGQTQYTFTENDKCLLEKGNRKCSDPDCDKFHTKPQSIAKRQKSRHVPTQNGESAPTTSRRAAKEKSNGQPPNHYHAVDPPRYAELPPLLSKPNGRFTWADKAKPSSGSSSDVERQANIQSATVAPILPEGWCKEYMCSGSCSMGDVCTRIHPRHDDLMQNSDLTAAEVWWRYQVKSESDLQSTAAVPRLETHEALFGGESGIGFDIPRGQNSSNADNGDTNIDADNGSLTDTEAKMLEFDFDLMDGLNPGSCESVSYDDDDSVEFGPIRRCKKGSAVTLDDCKLQGSPPDSMAEDMRRTKSANPQPTEENIWERKTAMTNGTKPDDKQLPKPVLPIPSKPVGCVPKAATYSPSYSISKSTGSSATRRALPTGSFSLAPQVQAQTGTTYYNQAYPYGAVYAVPTTASVTYGPYGTTSTYASYYDPYTTVSYPYNGVGANHQAPMMSSGPQYVLTQGIAQAQMQGTTYQYVSAKAGSSPGSVISTPGSATPSVDYAYNTNVVNVPQSCSSVEATDHLATFLEQIGLKKYYEVLQKHEVDWDALCLSTGTDLQACGIPVGPRLKIVDALQRYRESGSQAE